MAADTPVLSTEQEKASALCIARSALALWVSAITARPFMTENQRLLAADIQTVLDALAAAESQVPTATEAKVLLMELDAKHEDGWDYVTFMAGVAKLRAIAAGAALSGEPKK